MLPRRDHSRPNHPQEAVVPPQFCAVTQRNHWIFGSSVARTSALLVIATLERRIALRSAVRRRHLRHRLLLVLRNFAGIERQRRRPRLVEIPVLRGRLPGGFVLGHDSISGS